MIVNTGPSDERALPMSRILRRIRERFAKGQPLNITAVKRECPELIEPLYRPHAFVGWRKGLEQAGVSYSEIRVELADTVECLLCGESFDVLGRHIGGEQHGYTSDAYLEEFPGAEINSERARARRFGVFCRGSVSRESRSLIPHWEPLWSPEYALDRLFYLYEQGQSIHWQRLYTVEKALGAYLLRIFDTYDHALEAIGLQPARIRHAAPGLSWNRENILEAFRERISSGKSLAYSVVEEEFPALASSAPQYFGTYRAAIEALGIDYEREVVIDQRCEFKARYRKILAEARRLGSIPGRDWKEIDAFRKKYLPVIRSALIGGWKGLAAKAGVPVERLLHAWHPATLDRGTVMETLRQRHEAGLSLRFSDLNRDNHDLLFSAIKHFGKLSEARREAVPPPPPRPGRLSRYKDARAVTDAILRRKAAGKPLNGGCVHGGGKPELRDDMLYKKAVQFFGSWRKAVIAAGLDPLEEYPQYAMRDRYPTPESVIAGIRKRKAGGQSLRQAMASKPRNRGGNLALVTVAIRHFGSWQQALAAAGFDPDRESPWRAQKYPSAELVLESIRRRHREGLSLDTTFLQRHRISQGGDAILPWCAKKFFGSWDTALAAALGSQ